MKKNVSNRTKKEFWNNFDSIKLNTIADYENYAKKYKKSKLVYNIIMNENMEEIKLNPFVQYDNLLLSRFNFSFIFPLSKVPIENLSEEYNPYVLITRNTTDRIIFDFGDAFFDNDNEDPIIKEIGSKKFLIFQITKLYILSASYFLLTSNNDGTYRFALNSETKDYPEMGETKEQENYNDNGDY